MTRPYHELFLHIEIFLCAQKCTIIKNIKKNSNKSKVSQNFLREELGIRFVEKESWPQKLPDCSPLDYYFWYALSEEDFRGRPDPFTLIEE